MNNGFLIFLGVLFTVVWSWWGIIAKNFQDLGSLKPDKLPTGETYPGGRTGSQNLGQLVYEANGCASCHTMQVRMKGYGADIERGWGKRNSVLQDYLNDPHVFLGDARVGPDLASVGSRMPDLNAQLMHLYNPRFTVHDSMMPQYPFLFEKHKIFRGRSSPKALKLPESLREAGYEIIPTREGLALAEYLVSLRAETPIFEAPMLPPPAPKTNQTENASSTNQNSTSETASTNAQASPAAGATNSSKAPQAPNSQK
jgi:cytochrome c oxidase cbb3-type subunit 2